MSTETEVNQQQESNEANSSNQIQKAVKSVTKAKNPKCVEQGKKLAEHNKKMKQQLVQMKLADEESNEEINQNKIYQTVTENRNLILGSLRVAGVVIYLIWRNKCSASQHLRTPYY